MKTLQKFSKEYLEQSAKLSPKEILQFLADFRSLHSDSPKQKSKLISLKVPEAMLHSFQLQCKLKGLRYQTQIKELMKEWLSKSN